MPGPIIHKTAMEETVKLIDKSTDLSKHLSIKVGTYLQNMKPDTIGSHGWDFKYTKQGSILEKINTEYLNLICGLSLKYNIDQHIRNICHYIVDAHTIGQLSCEFHGRIDNRLDFFATFVSNKNKYEPKIKDYINLEHLEYILFSSMHHVYSQYYKQAKSIKFLFSKDFKHMIRNAIQKGAEFTYGYVDLAKRKEVG